LHLLIRPAACVCLSGEGARVLLLLLGSRVWYAVMAVPRDPRMCASKGVRSR